MSGPSTGGVGRPRVGAQPILSRTFPLVKPIDPVESSRTFHRFDQLPQELRNAIWELAVPGPRLVDINLGKKNGPITSCAPPAMLHVCHESRAILLP